MNILQENRGVLQRISTRDGATRLFLAVKLAGGAVTGTKKELADISGIDYYKEYKNRYQALNSAIRKLKSLGIIAVDIDKNNYSINIIN